MDMGTSSTRPAGRRAILPHLLDVGIAAVVGLIGGVLTSYLQGTLPDALAPLANSAAPWCAVAFAVATPARRPLVAVACAVLALLLLNLGYGLGSALRGYTYSTSTVLFWSAAAVVVGPLLGLSAHWIRRAAPSRAAVGAGYVVGILLGESAHGVTAIADTTPAGYWLVEAALGVLALVAVAATRLRRPLPIAISAATAVLVGGALLLTYNLL
jgi:hypothetical protein